jgi:hypothetical protein
MKSMLKEGWIPKWARNMPRHKEFGEWKPWQTPKPTQRTEFTNYVRHQITKAEKAARDDRARKENHASTNK